MGDTVKIRKPDFSKRLEKPSGRVVHDDRGSAVWQWSRDGHESALNLNPAALTLVDDQPASDSPATADPAAPGATRQDPATSPGAGAANLDWTTVRVETGASAPRNPQGRAFNPYGRQAAEREATEPRGKPKDLRALSKWIEMQRRLKASKEQAGED